MSVVEQIGKAIAAYLDTKRILEIACGCAEFSIMASAKADKVDCIDLDSSRLLPEVGNIKNLSFQTMDAARLMFADESFDTAVVYNAIGHLSSIVEQVTQESMRVLKNGGALIIITNWKLDRAVIFEKAIPYFEAKNIKYDIINKGKTTYVTIIKEEGKA